MNFNHRNSYLLSRTLLSGFVLFASLFVSFLAHAGADKYLGMNAKFRLRQTLHIEVAEDHTRFSFDEAPVSELINHTQEILLTESEISCAFDSLA